MKKALVILLIPVFLIAAVGVSVTSMYCAGIKTTGLNVKTCCKDVNKGGCCKTESQLLKVNDNFVKASGSSLGTKLYIIQEIKFPAFISIKPSLLSTLKNNWDKALPHGDSPLFILYRTLII